MSFIADLALTIACVAYVYALWDSRSVAKEEYTNNESQNS